jgi:hypothetical protein
MNVKPFIPWKGKAEYGQTSPSGIVYVLLGQKELNEDAAPKASVFVQSPITVLTLAIGERQDSSAARMSA